MPINFPGSPTNNQVYSYGTQSWFWSNNYGVWVSNVAIGYTGSAGTGGTGGGATGGGIDQVFYENDAVITTDYTVTANKNALSAGPITINSGVTVTISSNSVWTIV